MLYLNLLLKFWREAAIGALVLALGLVYARSTILVAQREALAVEKTTLQTKLKECNDGAAKLVAAIETQNAAIDKLKSDAALSAQRYGTELYRANATAAGFKQMADGLLKRPPDPKLNVCQNADALINEEILRVRK